MQDLLNTLDIEMSRDSISTPDGLARFAAEHALALSFDPDDLERCRVFREALRHMCSAHAGIDASARTVALLNEQLAQAPLIVRTNCQGAVEFEPQAGLTGASGLLAAVAAQITQARVAGTWERLKACEAQNCRWVYYDRSSAGHSRWCTMKICGSRAKMRAYRDRTQPA